MKEREFLLLVSLLVTALFAQGAGATAIDFGDLSLGASYGVGGSFTTSGVVITGQEFFRRAGGSTTTGSVEVGNGGRADGAGNELALDNINLSFDFGIDLYSLAMQYGEFGGNLNIEINGSFENFDDFADIDGWTIGGASVFTLDSGPAGNSSGALFVMGTINSFVIGGQELCIDNVVASLIPEPTTLVSLGIGGLMALTGKRPFI